MKANRQFLLYFAEFPILGYFVTHLFCRPHKRKKKYKLKKNRISLKKLSDGLAVKNVIELESIWWTSNFINSLEDFKKFEEIIIEKQKLIEKQTR